MKIFVALAFVGILGSLAAALVYMMRGPGGRQANDASEPVARKGGMAKALAFRLGFSIILFLCILLSWSMGWIEPTGIPVSRS